jgi:DNA-binding PadR family transcriptional regulator
MSDIMLRDFFLGFVRIHILYHAGHGPVFGLSLMQELRRHGYEVSPGTLYPMLHRLEGAGYLSREERVVGGKVRKYYAITEAGRAALAEARARIRELTSEVLGDEGPARLPEDDE